MGLIKTARELVNKAVLQIKKYQTGEDKPIVTRYKHFNENCLGGIFKQMIIIIAGVSGMGKTHILQEIEEDFFNKELNPDADEYILLRCNWEMTVFKLLLRKLKRTLHKTMKYILFNEPKEDEVDEFKTVCDSERNNNIFYLEDHTDPKTWYEGVREFLKEHADKKHILVTIDHIALVRDTGGNKKKAMDDLIEYINSLKKEFLNVSFIIISQMNRDIESRTNVKELAPRRPDLYNSDTMFHIADLVMVVHNPYKLGHSKYMVIRSDDYRYLIEWLDKPSNKTTNFTTKNAIFFHYLKMREIEDMENIKDIYVEPLVLNNIQNTIEQQEESQTEETEEVSVLIPDSDKVDKLDDPYLEEDNDIPF